MYMSLQSMELFCSQAIGLYCNMLLYTVYVPAETGECLSDIFQFSKSCMLQKHLKDIKNHSLYLT